MPRTPHSWCAGTASNLGLVAPAVALLVAVVAASPADAQREIGETHETGPSDTASADPRCRPLLDQAVGQLAAEQYPKMLRLAQDRKRLCPDPVSAFLVGLAQANMVDSLLISDPAAREQTRRQALRNLRVAAAGAYALEAGWLLTAHEWIVHLQGGGGSADSWAGVSIDSEALDEEPWLDEDDHWGGSDPLEIPKAPPPQPRPRFPWGPVITGTLGIAALSIGLALRLSASAKAEEARAAASQLRQADADGAAPHEQLRSWAQQTAALDEDAQSEAAWADGLLLSGAALVIAASVWYWARPPKGKWRWGAMDAGLQTTVRF